MGLISPSKTEGKLDRGFREIKETAPLQTEGAVVECPVTSPADITLVYLYYKCFISHLNSLESQKNKNPKKTPKPKKITEEIREKEAEK